MTFEDVLEMLEDTDLPVVYHAWPESEAPSLPYICYYYPSRNAETADDTHYANVYSLNVELYTENKDFETESAVEAVLLENGLTFDKEEDYLNDEHMYEVLYMTEVNIWEESATD